MTQAGKFTLRLAAALVALAGAAGALAQPKEVEIAIIEATTGPWSVNGGRVIKGAEMAVEEINAAGGIKSLGGAKIKLVVADAGARPDDAANAAQRVIASNPNIVGGAGAYISSQALAITEITERAGIPWLFGGSADQLTGRGFKHVFATNMPAGQVTPRIVPIIEQFAKLSSGGALKEVAILAVNTPGTIAVADGVEGALKARGVNVVAKEVFAIQLADGTAIAQRVRRARPSMIFFSTAIAPDTKTILTSLAQVGITPKNTPFFIYGGGAFDPEMLNLMPKEGLEGTAVFANIWPTKKSGDLEARWKQRTGQPWMTFDPAFGYGHVWVLKEALERAGSTDRAKVSEAMHALKLESGPAVAALNGPVSFDAKGVRVNPPALLLQWQNGVPVVAYPADVARAPLLKAQ
ncbi:ABC transporter substrate-binding protein [Ramlibacter sp.]|uniref:ABC transporter substrate-binding protein n=1 Tax=Ramlibacter sp. TaxID=1917967 RepID=UPI003D09E784